MIEWMQIDIELRLRAPLCIARRPTAPGQPIATRSYISGTALRGGIAGAWLAGRRYEDLGAHQDMFQALFLSPDLRFGNCWPVLLDEQFEPTATQVVPQTAWTAKRDGGWLWNRRQGSGVEDQLKTLLRGQPLPDDGDRVGEEFAAVLQAPGQRPRYRTAQVVKRQIARTELDSVRCVARSGRLYTLEAIEAGQVFRGSIAGRPDLLRQLCDRVVQAQQPLTLGQGRTRGLGEVVIEDVSELFVPPDERAAVAGQVQEFNRQLRGPGGGEQRWGDDLLLPVTLEADVLLRDKYLLPSTDPRPAVTLGRYLPLPEPLASTMTLVALGVMQSTHWSGGWDEIRRLPRSPQIAVAMGSVWTFRVPPNLLDRSVDWWLEAGRAGIGERRTEGYGRVRLCHPLHVSEGKL
jgi:CRISPR-associated Csx10 family RAMP protein